MAHNQKGRGGGSEGWGGGGAYNHTDEPRGLTRGGGGGVSPGFYGI